MAYYLGLLIDREDLRRRMGETARKHVVRTYDWKVIIHRYEDLWEELYKISREARLARSFHKERWFRADYFKDFCHYATVILSNEPLYLTDYGIAIKEGNLQLKPYQEMKSMLSQDVIWRIFDIVAQSKGVEIETVIKRLIQDTGISEENARYHLMWMLKYNLLSISRMEDD